MSELDGTGVGEYVVVVFAAATGPMRRSHTSSRFKLSCTTGLVGLGAVDPLKATGADIVWFPDATDVVWAVAMPNTAR